jgi:hypothetical protein
MKIKIEVEIKTNGKYCIYFCKFCQFHQYYEENFSKFCFTRCHLFTRALDIESNVKQKKEKILRCKECLKYKGNI